MLKYLLDTNIVIYVIKRRPIEVLDAFNTNANRMAISVVTLAELLHGAKKVASPLPILLLWKIFAAVCRSCLTCPKQPSTMAPSEPR